MKTISISDEHKQKMKAAYKDFKAKATVEEHDSLMALFHQAHHELHQMLEDWKHGRPLPPEPVEIPELCLALTALEAEIEVHQFPDDFFYIDANGNIWGFEKYENLDWHWVEAPLEALLHIFTPVPFGENPARIPISGNVSLGIIGDWGTGYWQGDETPAKKIADQFPHLHLDFTIHLGDVYYTGTEHKENNNFVELWPQGRHGSLALNSNHEMYPKGTGYFNVALERLFTQQNKTSYFHMENDFWVIIGLDSAYQSTKFYSKGYLSAGQQQWLMELAPSIRGRKVMVLSHHLGLSLDGSSRTTLFRQVAGSLGRIPDYWYWGHAHNAAVYKPQGKFHGRVCGHGAIPYGNASILQNSTVEWYETSQPNPPASNQRVKNGFVVVHLDGPSITERFIDEDGCVPWETSFNK